MEVHITAQEASELLDGIKSDLILQFDMTQPEVQALKMAIQVLKDLPDIDRLKTECVNLRQYNRLYYSKFSDYITLFDNWRKSKNNPDDHAYYQEECKKIEQWMREERDRVQAIVNKKNDKQLTLNLQ